MHLMLVYHVDNNDALPTKHCTLTLSELEAINLADCLRRMAEGQEASTMANYPTTGSAKTLLIHVVPHRV